jgi:tetratricopeptide (TPR) repeat protein
VSETKETESGAKAQDEAATEGAPTSKDDAESTEQLEAPGTDAEEAGQSAEAAPGDATVAPKKKKKKRDAAEPETIRDRNARVRAEAADKRRARRDREQGTAPRRNLDASEVMDDALARSTHAAAGFLTRHFNKVQWLIMAGLAGWIGYEVYAWRHARTAEKASDALFKALSAETGKVGAAEPDMGDERGLPSDERRSFATDEDRLKIAKKEYELALATTGSVIAQLGEAGVAYDLGQYKDAQAAYEKVKQNPAFAKDTDIKGRTLEGLGMALEAQKNEDAALKSFRELQSMDNANFSALGMYHQARILKQNGKTDEALKLLDKAGEKLATLKETPAVIRYVGRQVVELLETVDPKKATELTEKLLSTEAKKQREEMGALGPGGGKNMSADMQRRIQELMEKIKKEAPPASSAAPAPGPVAPPQDAPLAPPQDAPAPAPSGAP